MHLSTPMIPWIFAYLLPVRHLELERSDDLDPLSRPLPVTAATAAAF